MWQWGRYVLAAIFRCCWLAIAEGRSKETRSFWRISRLARVDRFGDTLSPRCLLFWVMRWSPSVCFVCVSPVTRYGNYFFHSFGH